MKKDEASVWHSCEDTFWFSLRIYSGPQLFKLSDLYLEDAVEHSRNLESMSGSFMPRVRCMCRREEGYDIANSFGPDTWASASETYVPERRNESEVGSRSYHTPWRPTVQTSSS